MKQTTWLAVLLLPSAIAWGCRSADTAVSAGTADASSARVGAEAPPVVAMSTTASVGDAGAMPAAIEGPLPDLSTRAKIFVRQGQGGPANLRCSGVVYEIEVDLGSNAWVYRHCDAPNAATAPTAPLVAKKGHLAAADRARLDAAYRSLHTVAHPRCASDAGRQAIELRGADGGVADRYACDAPFGVSDDALVRVLLAIVNAA